ncbi:MAG: ABC transporter substrate-binding protein [Clostridia bacterium]|nr:ABC transporter substrate-binding protein [Clostridia bacterium]
MKKTLMLLAAALVCALAFAGVSAEAALPDGAYEPDDFTFSGGSGRVVITCPQVVVENGDAVASIVFSSPNYTVLTLDGVVYEAANTDDVSVFELPAPLNRSFEIAAVTTAMSKPHEIAYTLCIRLDAAGEGGLPGLVYESSMELDYAVGFSVDYYAGGYRLITVKDGGRYLAVPEGMSVPEGLDPGIVALRKPPENVYMAATAVMALFDRLDALDPVRFSSLREEDWHVENAAAAMRAGSMLFAGKYSEPDYELLVREGCGLAVESTMILHTPKVRELLELLGIQVFVDRSSYEPHPLGRTEWIRLYGALLDREAEAEAFFDSQKAAVEALTEIPSTGRIVAYFYINTNGAAVVRGADDYIARMIELGGGVYAFADMEGPNRGHAAVTVTMEDFYAAAMNADFLVYSASIDQSVDSLESLAARSPLLAELQAVKEGRVFLAGEALYQATDTVTSLIEDIRGMLEGRETGMTFLTKLR